MAGIVPLYGTGPDQPYNRNNKKNIDNNSLFLSLA
jgi:hypothetical protein